MLTMLVIRFNVNEEKEREEEKENREKNKENFCPNSSQKIKIRNPRQVKSSTQVWLKQMFFKLKEKERKKLFWICDAIFQTKRSPR